MFATDPQPSTDGRRRRSEQSRDRIVAAMMTLVEEGKLNPVAEEVADRAEVGLRSVFRHFKDMDSLYAEMALRLARHYQDALAPFESADWRGQLFEAIDRRIGIYERLLPFKRAADAHRHESVVIQNSHEATTQLLRARLRSLLPPHFQDDRAAFETLDFLLSVDSWQRLRTEQGLGAGQARDVIETLVKSLVDRPAAG
jgi:AcrR family transcriptional regulator